MQDDCGEDQSCLNTNGSYLCVPTPCPDDFERDNLSGQCVQMCASQSSGKCTDDATVAQTISYTLLPLKEMPSFVEPILKVVSYDLQRMPLLYTKFSFVERGPMNDHFVLETIPHKMGIAYLYARPTIQTERLYKLQVVGHSYDENGDALLYVTQFVVYVFVAE